LSLIGEGANARLTSVLIAASFAMVFVFVLVERRVKVPLFASTALRARLFVLSNTAGFAVHAAMMGAVVLMPLYLQGVRGFTAAETGLAMLPQVMTWLAATLLCGVLISRKGRVKPFAIAGAAFNSAGLGMLAFLQEGTSLWLLSGALAVFGLGQGFALQAFTVSTQAEVPSSEMGQATGLASFTRSVGSVLGVAVSGAVLGVSLASGHPLLHAFGWAIGVSVPVALTALVAALAMPEVRFAERMRATPSLH
jgi:MFS family permease